MNEGDGVRGEPQKKLEGLLASSMGKTCLWLDPMACIEPETCAYDGTWDSDNPTETENTCPNLTAREVALPVLVEIKLPAKCTHLRWNSTLQMGLATFRQTPDHPKTSHLIFKLNNIESSEMTPTLLTTIKGNSIGRVLSRSLLCSLSGQLLTFAHNEELGKVEVWDGNSGELLQVLGQENPTRTPLGDPLSPPKELVSGGENPWDIVHYKVGARDYIGVLKPDSLMIYSLVSGKKNTGI
jgi:hypothetical protein